MNDATETLLRTALEAAFPERGAALAREIRRWFDDSRSSKLPPGQGPKDDGTRPCVLCDRPSSSILAIARMVPVAKKKRAQFQIPGANAPMDAPPGSLHACSACLYGWVERFAELGRDPAAWPHPDMVLTDARRALQAEGSEAAFALLGEIDERRDRTAPRRAGTATCDVCKARGLTVSGRRARICPACVEAAQKPLGDLVAMLGRLR